MDCGERAHLSAPQDTKDQSYGICAVFANASVWLHRERAPLRLELPGCLLQKLQNVLVLLSGRPRHAEFAGAVR